MQARLQLACALVAVLTPGLQSLGNADDYRWDLPKAFPKPRVPAGNPMSYAKVELGRRLFYDKRLSLNGTQSCASCHKQELAFTDGRDTSMGATGQTHPRSAMSLVNVAYSAALTWSNPNLQTLEKQALIPMFSEHPVELGMLGKEDAVLSCLRSDPLYRALFRKSFPEAKDCFSIANVAKALAAFERSIISARSPYDRYYYGGEQNAISDSAKRGEILFFNDLVGGCFRCHGGFNFSDATEYEGSGNGPVEFHNTGLYNLPGPSSYPSPNVGISEHTRKQADEGKFKAPSLRNVALTAPYMHDGSIATLEEVLDHYAAGGRTIASGPHAGRGFDNPHKDRRMTGITFSAQNRKDLIAFLNSLTDTELIHDTRFSNPW
ncbi:MAG: cytochrome c peroxidase [Verrucomicrobiota bacterium]|jgi:cytochrome c peroxidase